MKFIPLAIYTMTAICIAGQAHIPETHAVTSQNGKFIFIMTAPKLSVDGKTVEHGKSTAYQVRKDGSLQKQWLTAGWYSNRIKIDDSGKYLIRRGNRNVWSKFLDFDTAVAFFKEGKLIKEYKIKDLISNEELAKSTKNSWEILNRDYPKLVHQIYSIKTAAGKVISFDITSGKIVSGKEK